MNNGKKNSRFKICILTSGFPRYKGDLSGNFILSLAKELIKQGMKVFVLAPHAPNTNRSEKLDGIEVYRFSYFLPAALQKVCYGSGVASNVRYSLLARLQLPLFSFSQLFSLIWFIKKEKIDIVNSHWMVTQGLNGAVVKKFLGVRHIATVHSAGLFALKRLPLGGYIARFIVNNSDRIVTVSSFIKSNLDELVGYDTKAAVCPMGIDTNTFVSKDQAKLKEKYGIESKHILLFVGRLIEVKGIKYLIEAVGIASGRLPDLKLLIAGTGNLERGLKEKVKKSNLSSYISFLGDVKHENLIDYYNICDLVILPSIIDKYGQTESLGIVILEAMSCGKPVIASNVGALPEIVKDGYNGALVNPGNAVDLASKITKILKVTDKNLLQKNARRTAEQYSWSNIGKKHSELILNGKTINNNHRL